MQAASLAVSRSLAEGPFSRFHGRRAWPGLGVHLYRCREFVGHRLAMEGAHVLILVQKGCGRLHQKRGHAACESLLTSGSVIFAPAGAQCLWSGTLPECVALSIAPDPIAPDPIAPDPLAPDPLAPADAGGNAVLASVAGGRDPFVEQVAALLAADIERHVHGADGVLWTSIRRALHAHLERNYAASARPVPQMAGLTGPKLARVVDFVEARLGEPVTLDQMAAVAAIGRFHFARMFKLAVGVTPMAYVERARIEHAKALLQDGGLPLAEVAARVGFADQSHFTRRFRRHTGRTPAIFARQAAWTRPQGAMRSERRGP